VSRYTPPAKPQGFERAELRDMNDICGPQRLIAKDCPVCAKPVMIHCENCLVAVTGCACTLQEKVEQAKRAQMWNPHN